MLGNPASILVIGGAGYVGSVLVPHLLERGHRVRVLDLFIYGETLPRHEALEAVRADVRDRAALARALVSQEVVIHLACISNDPSFDLDPALGRSINYEAFGPCLMLARDSGVRRFIFASSSSVYGVSREPEVDEDHPLRPITDYARFKARCEEQLWSSRTPGFAVTAVRPATICGTSPRQRFDLTVNLLTNHAVNRGAITIFGGQQLRPNLHMRDMIDLYALLCELPAARIDGQVFNVGYQNLPVAEIAAVVKRTVETEHPGRPPVTLTRTETNDPRSYHITARRLHRELGFVPGHTIEEAVRELCAAFRSGAYTEPLSNPCYVNVEMMKRSTLPAVDGSTRQRVISS